MFMMLGTVVHGLTVIGDIDDVAFERVIPTSID